LGTPSPAGALAVARELAGRALELPDNGISARYPDVEITSARQHLLFEIFHVLLHLDAPLAESLLAGHSELAAAIRRYPFGVETIREEAQRREAEIRREMAASGKTCEGFILTGSGDPARQLALARSARAGDFAPSIDYGLELYAADTGTVSPNQALQAFWPSTCSFRNTLHAAGRRLGAGAATFLDRIPDPDLRLFARIELAAALAGLPAMPETSMKQHPRPQISGTPMLPPAWPVIVCPNCRWIPVLEARWPCRCGHVWNTFRTRGQCPGCSYRWEITQCLACQTISPHQAWYPLEQRGGAPVQ
jgi:hypothetical protein